MTKNERFIACILAGLNRYKTGRLSAWSRGVNLYAEEIAQEVAEGIRGGYILIDDLCNSRMIERAMLNGAANWHEYSWGGWALIYDWSIAERLCSRSEFRKTKSGTRKPNNREQWLDTQARALYQASLQVASAISAAYDELCCA